MKQEGKILNSMEHCKEIENNNVNYDDASFKNLLNNQIYVVSNYVYTKIYNIFQ